MLDYGFLNTKVNILKRKGEVIDTVSFSKANPSRVSISLADDLIAVSDVDEDSSYQFDVQMDEISLPANKGDVVGKINVLQGKKVFSSAPLVLNEDVQKMGFWRYYYEQLRSTILGEINI